MSAGVGAVVSISAAQLDQIIHHQLLLTVDIMLTSLIPLV